jgi:hypothetical protein
MQPTLNPFPTPHIFVKERVGLAPKQALGVSTMRGQEQNPLNLSTLLVIALKV